MAAILRAAWRPGLRDPANGRGPAANGARVSVNGGLRTDQDGPPGGRVVGSRFSEHLVDREPSPHPWRRVMADQAHPPVRLITVFAVAILSLTLAIPSGRAQPPPDMPVGEPFPADPLTRNPDGEARDSAPSPLTTDRVSATDWRTRIDQAWGANPLTIQRMLEIYDTFWNEIDQEFACFQGLDVDWDALRSAAHAEIQGGVSRGRFAAIMNHLGLALRESHTHVADFYVNYAPLIPGMPLFVVGGWGDNGHFGAGLTPLPDSSLLVYQVAPNHPLGLEPGDIVLGYGGVPWKRLYRELLAAQLPLTGWWWGSSESSWTHSMLMSAGLNWHLFETIDVLKHSTGNTVHLSVAPLASYHGFLDCTEQLPVPGVPMPSPLGAAEPVSWGIVDGTRIGYVYVRAWAGNAGTRFYEAIHTLLTQYQTTGLIFDFRTNYGGNMFLAYPGLELLFGADRSTIAFARRCNPTDHLAMCPEPNGPSSYYVIHAGAAADYDHPIAVLVGPGAVSSGDQVAHLFRFHPRARFFGKSTSTAFNAPRNLPLGSSSWYSLFAAADAFRVDAPGDYLTHDELRVDEAVWLRPDDVARGLDTVAEAAIRWISNHAPALDGARAAVDDSWVPEHQMEPVAIAGVTDPDGDPVAIDVTKITQDEPPNGTGDGDACPDAMVVDGVARLR